MKSTIPKQNSDKTDRSRKHFNILKMTAVIHSHRNCSSLHSTRETQWAHFSNETISKTQSNFFNVLKNSYFKYKNHIYISNPTLLSLFCTSTTVSNMTLSAKSFLSDSVEKARCSFCKHKR